MKILVTGASGYLGRRLIPALEKDHDLVLGDLDAPPGDPRRIVLDVTRPPSVRVAMAGVEAVVHLAVASGREGEEEDEAFNQLRFDVNVRGTWNVLEAARQAGVRRFVHTSSLMVVWGYPPPIPVAGDAPARPVGTYALTKHLAEQAAAHVAREHGLSVVCLRISKPLDLDEPRWCRATIRPQWLAFPDLVQAYRLALTAPGIGFEVVTVVGTAARQRWDLDRAERVLGYRPAIRLEDLGYQLGDERAAYPPLS